MSENLSLPLVPTSQSISNTTGNSLTIDVSEEATTSYELIFPAANASGNLTNDGNGNLSWEVAAVTSSEPDYYHNIKNFMVPTMQDAFHEFSQQTILYPSISTGTPAYGEAVAISADGNYAVVGAPFDDTTGTNAGATYVYIRNGTTWTQQTILYPTTSGGRMGSYVSISADGTYIVVGAVTDSSVVTTNGAAYIFIRNVETWSLQVKLTPSYTGGPPFFGYGVSISNDSQYVLVGAPGDNTTATGGGATYVFIRNGATWTQQTILYPSVNGNQQMGANTDISSDGKYAVCGAYFSSIVGTNAGAVYVYIRSGTTWSQQTVLYPTTTTTTPFFGYDVSISSDGRYLLSGTLQDDVMGTNAGATYVYERRNTTWTLQTILYPSITLGSPNLGYSCSLSANGQYAVIGAYADDTIGTNAGATYVFIRNGTTWTEQTILYPTIGTGTPQMGYSVTISADGQYILSGANLNDVGATDAGAVYVFTNSNNTFVPIMHTNNGTAAAPSHSFTNDSDTGIFRSAANTLGFSTGGTSRFTLSNSLNTSSNRIHITDTTNPTTVGTGALLINGGIGLGNGSATASRITFGSYTANNPLTNKVIALFDSNPSNDYQFYGFGVNANLLRYTTSSTFADHVFYAATSSSAANEIFRIKGTGVAVAQDGTAAAPAYSFVNDSNTGIFSSAADTIGFSTGGTSRVTLSTTSFASTLPFQAEYYHNIKDYQVSTQSDIFHRFSQNTILYPSITSGSPHMGTSVSISANGQYALCGAPYDNVAGSIAGAVYVFIRSGSTWTQQAILYPSIESGFPEMGYSVSISAEGTYALCGAWSDNVVGSDAGAVYVFVRSGTSWSQQTIFYPSVGTGTPLLGTSVSISADGTYALCGSPTDDTMGTNAGAGYVFVRNGTTWTQQTILYPSVGTGTPQMGFSVSISADGQYAICGANLDDTAGSDAGAVYVFVRSGTSWSQQTILYPSVTTGSPQMGYSVSISADGQYVVCGASRDDVQGTNAGASYVFIRNRTTWTQQKILYPSVGTGSPQMGFSVSISANGQYVLCGAYLDDITNSNAGAVYVFVRNGIAWVQQKILYPSVGTGTPQMGYSVSISADGQYVLCGTNLDDVAASDAGAVYVFGNDGSSSVAGNITLNGVGSSTASSSTLYSNPNSTTFSSSNDYYFNYLKTPVTTGSTTGIASTLYIEGSAPNATTSYALFVNSGDCRINSSILLGDISEPSTKTNKVYSVSGSLKYNGQKLVTRENYTITNVNASTYTVVLSDDIVAVQYTATGSVTITLPNITTFVKITIIDEAGNAATNNIIISADASDTINGQASLILNTNYASVTIFNNGVSKWFIF